MDAFLHEAEELLLAPTSLDGKLAFSQRLKTQFRQRLDDDSICMLPSHHHVLPSGLESGIFFAIDLGGTTLRMALIDLAMYRPSRQSTALEPEIRVLRRFTRPIGDAVKALVGRAFFGWLADRICETVEQWPDHLRPRGDPKDSPQVYLALAWSFPIDQTSIMNGLIQEMGKDFHASDGMIGQDLYDVLTEECRSRGMHLGLRAILNDSDATLLSKSYIHRSTRMGLILGTGANISCYMPVCSLGKPKKLDTRHPNWHKVASHVIVNVELDCFGGDGVMPATRWDDALREAHPKPDFQPFEYYTSGLYLGEICRLVLVEAIQKHNAFGGVVPESLVEYSLGTEILSAFEADISPQLETARELFITSHPSDPSVDDLRLIKSIARLVSRRSAALIATAIYTLWGLRRDYETVLANSEAPQLFIHDALNELNLAHTVVAYTGSVIERYPGYRALCQEYINELLAHASQTNPALGIMQIELAEALESSLIGAAVAGACFERSVLDDAALRSLNLHE